MELALIGGLIVAAMGLAAVISFLKKRARRQHLMEKYGDPQVVQKIIDKIVWQGMTVDQLIDSWGPPDDQEVAVLKTKTKKTWKYGMTGKNRFRQRVIVENDIVVGWQSR